MCRVVGRGPVVFAGSIGRLLHVTAAGELHLKRMHALTRHAVVTRGPAAFEATVEYVTCRAVAAHRHHRVTECSVAGGAVMGSGVVWRKLSGKQSGNG